MADRWMDERDREWRERDWRRAETYGRGEERGRNGETRRWGEDRTFEGAADEEGGPYEEMSRRGGPYGGPEQDYGEGSRIASGGGTYGGGAGGESSGRSGGGRGQAYQTGPGQTRYGGQGPRFQPQDYTGRRNESRDSDDSGYRARQGGGYGRQEERGWEPPQARQGYGAESGRGWDREAYRYGQDRSYGGRDDQDHRDRESWEERREGGGDFLQRAGERISSWFRGENLMRGSRDDEQDEPRRYREDFGREARPIERGHRGMGPKGYQRSDERISDEVHDRLTDDPWLDASNIQVEVKSGEVTLSGHVDNREAKHRAERLIEDLSGVRHVQNNLRVDASAGFTGAGRGFGSSALEAEMRRHEQATDPGNHGVSGLSGRTSTGAQAERSTGTAAEGSVDPKTGAKRS